MNPTDDARRFETSGLWEKFFGGDRPACARLISLIENEPSARAAIRDRLLPRLGGAVRIGVTGPPGVGKSTLAAALARRALDENRSVGIIAVDPTSPFTGGAFLGDRVRMQSLIGDPRIFIRSMAARDGRGGLSPAAPDAADVLDAFGMDRIFIETLGVGQAELDVMTCADILVLVLQPGTGDAIQTLKAGIIETADLIVVNKTDMPGADNLLEALRFVFDAAGRAGKRAAPPILTASAVEDRGLNEIWAALEGLIIQYRESGRLREKSRARLESEIRAAITGTLWERYIDLVGGPEDIAAAAERLAREGGSPYPFIRKECGRIKMALAESGAPLKKTKE